MNNSYLFFMNLIFSDHPDQIKPGFFKAYGLILLNRFDFFYSFTDILTTSIIASFIPSPGKLSVAIKLPVFGFGYTLIPGLT